MTRREWSAVLLGAIVLTALLTWPMVARFGTSGRAFSGDGRYSLWNVAWVGHALTSDPADLFDANIFDPHPNALAFSEANLLAGAIGAPVWAATGNPYATLHAATFVGFVLAFVLSYALVRRLTGSPAGAAFGALTFTFCPYVFSHLAHIQLLMTFGLPLVLLAMHRFVDAPSPGRAAALGAAMAVAALGSGYYGIFGGLAAGLGVLWFGVAGGRVRDWRYWAMALAAPAVAAVIVAPAFLPYVDIQNEGFARSLDDARRYSATWRAYLASAGLLHRWMLPWLDSWREVLFPGFLPIAFSALALLWARRSGPADTAAARAGHVPVIGFYLTLAVLAVWTSAGPDAGLYYVLHEALPFFSLLRAPVRIGVLVTLALAVLGGVGVAALLERAPAARRAFVAALVLIAAVADSTVGPIPLDDALPVPEATRRLAQLPRAPVAEFPFYEGADRHQHTEYMLLSTYHWQRLVNGYSDHMPPQTVEEMPVLARFPSPDALAVLQRHNVRWVVVHWRLYPPDAQPGLREAVAALAPHLRPVVEKPEASLYEVVSWP